MKELLEGKLGAPLTWADFSLEKYNAVLGAAYSAGQSLYTPSHLLKPHQFIENAPDYISSLVTLEHMMLSGLPERLQKSKDMAEGFSIIRSYPVSLVCPLKTARPSR